MELFQFFNNLMTLLGSTIDLGSDVINSLDLLNLGATKWILKSANICDNYRLGFNYSELLTNICADNMLNPAFRKSWGIAGLVIVFLPGIVLLPVCVLGAIRGKNWKFLIIFLVFVPLYPIAVILIQLLILLSFCNVAEKSVRRIGLIAIGMEAFFGSFCQLVLQGYTILYGYPVTITQVISMSFSLLSLARTSICLDITMK